MTSPCQATPRLTGIVTNRVKRTGEHAYREAELRTAYGELVLPGAIPERIAVADAAGRGVPIHESSGEWAVAAVLDTPWAELVVRVLVTMCAPNTRTSRPAGGSRWLSTP